MQKSINLTLLSVLIIASFSPAFSQVAISGPTCVVSGTVYQYTISGPWDSTATMQVCVTAGSIADTSIKGNCTEQTAPLGAIQIVWSESGNGSISITSTKGNASLQVQLTTALQPGVLNDHVKFQMVDSGTVPATISCSLPTGGSCNPSYQYQWQRSYNAVAWEDIGEGNDQDFIFTTSPDHATYYRRKTTETLSGTIVYSEPALVGLNLRNN